MKAEVHTLLQSRLAIALCTPSELHRHLADTPGTCSNEYLQQDLEPSRLEPHALKRRAADDEVARKRIAHRDEAREEQRLREVFGEHRDEAPPARSQPLIAAALQVAAGDDHVRVLFLRTR